MKKILILTALLFTSLTLSAGPIGEQRARQIATDFFASQTTRAIASNIELEWAGNNIGDECAKGNELNNSLIYIYNFGANEGFVVVSGDSNSAPIIAFSLDTSLDVNNMAEATATILDAWCKQVENARKSAMPISGTAMPSPTRAGDEVLYETAMWNQDEPFNLEAPFVNNKRALTGCAATAMAIICHYHRWPECGEGTTPAYSYEVYSASYDVEANTLGRKYEYDKMLMSYNNGYTQEQGDAVAALMKDMGTSIEMNYHYIESTTISALAVPAFTKYFNYSKNAEHAFGRNYSPEEWSALVRENLRQYGPTFFCGEGPSGGHAFVVDGFKADDYFHFNFGWGGIGNGYFLIPNIEYYQNQSIIMRLVPDKEGKTEYCDSMFILSYEEYIGIDSKQAASYTKGVEFECVIGGFLNLGATTFVGDIALMLCDREGNIKENLHSIHVEAESMKELFIKDPVRVTITSDIETGDRLRLYYKGDHSDEWKWMRCYDNGDPVDEVLVKAAPTDIADGLRITLDKSSRTLGLQNKHAMLMTLYDNDTNALLASDDYMMREVCNFADLEHRTYRVEMSLGGEPYVLIVKL